MELNTSMSVLNAHGHSNSTGNCNKGKSVEILNWNNGRLNFLYLQAKFIFIPGFGFRGNAYLQMMAMNIRLVSSSARMNTLFIFPYCGNENAYESIYNFLYELNVSSDLRQWMNNVHKDYRDYNNNISS